MLLNRKKDKYRKYSVIYQHLEPEKSKTDIDYEMSTLQMKEEDSEGDSFQENKKRIL